MATMERPLTVEAHLALVCSIAMKFTSERPIEDTDQFSDGVLGLMKAIENFDSGRRYQFSTYSYHVITHFIKDGWRRRNKHATRLHFVDPIELTGSRCDPDHIAAIDSADTLATMRANIQRLPTREREVILARLQGLKLREIAAVLGLTKERVRQIEERATGSLRCLMAQAGAIG